MPADRADSSLIKLAGEARYDHARNKWWPQCPHGDECSGCDATGRCSKAPTAGEQLLGRELAKEIRSGVEHYVPGQRQAVISRGREYGNDRPCEIGRITYVDAMGHACVVLTYRYTDEPDEWRATWVVRAGQTWKSEARKVEPGEFPLSEAMLAALADAPYEQVPS